MVTKNLSLGLFTFILAHSALSCNAENLPSVNLSGAEIESPSAAPSTAVPSCDLTFSRMGLCASLSFDSTPHSENENPFTVKFFSMNSGSAEAGPFVDPAGTVSIKLWMPSMGHGSSPVTTTRVTTGVFRATSVYFVMPGDWEIRVLVKNGTTLVDQASLFLDHVE